MYTYEFEDLLVQGMEWEDYQALLRDMAIEEITFADPEFRAWCDSVDAQIDIDEMASYYGQ